MIKDYSDDHAYFEGRSSYCWRMGRWENPYPMSSHEWREWDNGWMDECAEDDGDAYRD